MSRERLLKLDLDLNRAATSEGASGLRATERIRKEVLARLTEESRTGRRMTTSELVKDTGYGTAQVRDALNSLDNSGDALFDGLTWVAL